MAEREYRLVTNARRRQKVLLQLGRPRRSRRAGEYCCGFHIHGLDGCSRGPRFLNGVNAVQALYMAMEVALTELLWTDAYEEGRLTWNGVYDLGLPVAGAANRRRMRKDPRAERMKREVAAMLAEKMRPRGRPRSRAGSALLNWRLL